MSYLDYNQSNGYLLLPYLEELISVDHVARVVKRVVDLLGIRELTSQEKIEDRPAYHP
jgi:transposase